ncbi:hypothetical protein EV426DRAFT_700033 [Tirmania nivea]|nr:hypothetical protein EV426DRAFT_700033 [Tirmania nivea]
MERRGGSGGDGKRGRTVMWMKGHSGEKGNEKADRKAKETALFIKQEASAITAVNANFLEYVIQLYDGPGSVLKIPKTKDTSTTLVISSKPIAWDTAKAAVWIGRMWKDAAQRPLLEGAFKPCPQLT